MKRVATAVLLMLLASCSALAQQAVSFNGVAQPVTTNATQGVVGRLVNVNDVLTINAAGQQGIGAWFRTGNFIGTLVAECSMNAGSFWVQTFFDRPDTSTTATLALNAPTTPVTVSIMPMGGCGLYRVRVASVTSGEVTGALSASTGIDPSVLFTTIANTNLLPPSIAVVGGLDPAGIIRTVATTTTGVQLVTSPAGLPLQLCNALIRYNCQR